MNKLSFSTKMSLMLLFSCLLVATLVAGVAVYQQISASRASLEALRKTLYTDYDHTAKTQVEAAISLLKGFHDRSQNGEITPEEARQQSARALGDLRFDNGNYFWADTLEGVNVVLPNKAVNGTNRMNLQDKKGNYIVREIIEKGKQPGGGYTDYWFPRAGSDTPLPKRSYSLEFKPFGWVVGTGNYVDDLEKILAKEQARFKKEVNSGALIFSAITLVALVISLLFARLFANSLTKVLGGEPDHIAEIASRIASGDLTIQKTHDARGILRAMQEMAENLGRTMTEISQLANRVADDGRSLQENIASMAQGAHENASQAGTVSVASEEMAATSNDIANNCHLAADSAQHAADTTQQGFNVVKQTVEGIRQRGEMTRRNSQDISSLGERSDQIGAIVATIEDIADQTNLLALNAAIEAARAGEMGRGFAVVADEVRALAERTTRATKEISDMIKAIQGETKKAITSMESGVTDMEQGAIQAEQLETALQSILEQVNAVTMQVSQIATAAEEQTATTGEITKNIMHISEIAQNSSVTASQSAQATEHLAQVSNTLQTMVSRFRLR